MNEKEALKILEEMAKDSFQSFYKKLPYRIRLCCEGGLVNWKEVLPYWYLKLERDHVLKQRDSAREILNRRK